jgi:hypothetical protein
MVRMLNQLRKGVVDEETEHILRSRLFATLDDGSGSWSVVLLGLHASHFFFFLCSLGVSLFSHSLALSLVLMGVRCKQNPADQALSFPKQCGE